MKHKYFEDCSLLLGFFGGVLVSVQGGDSDGASSSLGLLGILSLPVCSVPSPEHDLVLCVRHPESWKVERERNAAAGVTPASRIPNSRDLLKPAGEIKSPKCKASIFVEMSEQ